MQMNFTMVLGVVGSIASVVGLLLPIQSKHQKAIHLAYGLGMTILASSAVWYWQENLRIHNVERAATKLLEQADMNVPTIGFNQAALAFLEKNKDLYPDSYARAQEICNVNKCLWMSKGENRSVDYQQIQNQKNVCDALIGLIRGISVLENSQ